MWIFKIGQIKCLIPPPKNKKKQPFEIQSFDKKCKKVPENRWHTHQTIIERDPDTGRYWYWSVGQSVLVSSSESHYWRLCHPVSELSTDIGLLYNGFIWINKCEPLCIHVSKCCQIHTTQSFPAALHTRWLAGPVLWRGCSLPLSFGAGYWTSSIHQDSGSNLSAEHKKQINNQH